MISGLINWLRFHCARLLRAQSGLWIGCLASIALLIVAVVAFLCEAKKVEQRQMELDRLRLASRQVSSVKVVDADLTSLNLPWFESAQVIAQFGRAAADAKLPVDEVQYLLEESSSRPYLRYRIKMTVSSGYPVIRQFADEVTATMTHVDLDSMSCTRGDIDVLWPTCILTFSAFFRNDIRE